MILRLDGAKRLRIRIRERRKIDDYSQELDSRYRIRLIAS